MPFGAYPHKKHWLPTAAYMASKYFGPSEPQRTRFKANPRGAWRKKTMARSRFNRRRKPRRGGGKRRNKRRKRAKYGERRMRKGGNKLTLKTFIIPKETFVRLPIGTTLAYTTPITSSKASVWFASFRNTLYWPLSFTGTRNQHMVRGADAWASFYRQYEVLGMKIKGTFYRDNASETTPHLSLVVHVGQEDRSNGEGTGTSDDFKSQKNTRVYPPMYVPGVAGATNNGIRMTTRFNKYVSMRYIARESVNKATFSGLTGLPATAGADGTDPAFDYYINLGLASHNGTTLVDAATAVGRCTFKIIYYVRFFDRKYFLRDLDGDGDEGPATAQTVAPGVGVGA